MSGDDTPREHYTAYESGPVSQRTQWDMEIHARVQSLEDSRSVWKWVAGLGIPAVLSAMFVFLLYAADKISTSAERVGEQRAEIRALQDEVHNLRLKIDKLVSVDRPAVTIVQAP